MIWLWLALGCTPEEGGKTAVDVDADGFAAVDDCDDEDAAVYPGAAERCNQRDDNCDALVDNAPDADGDGTPDCQFEACDGLDNDGDGAIDEDFADSDGDGSADCRDTETCDGVDNNGDGEIDEGFDADSDGSAPCGATPDCDDADPSRSPGQTETSNGLDDDCDGAVDENESVAGDLLITELMINPGAADEDGGEWVELENRSSGAIALAGLGVTLNGASYTIAAADLVLAAGERLVVGDSADPMVNGGAPVAAVWSMGEGLPNSTGTLSVALGGVTMDTVHWAVLDGGALSGTSWSLDPDHLEAGDNDEPAWWCAAVSVWEGSRGDRGSPGALNPLCPTLDRDGDGWTAAAGDCDDADPAAYPGQIEAWYDGVDADCSAGSDHDQDGDGDDLAPLGSDCDDSDPARSGVTEERCDLVDNDCDGLTDDDDPSTVDRLLWYADADGDGFGAEPAALEACDAALTWSDRGGDCDDSNASVWPGAPETWYDGLDGDCGGGDDDDADADGYAAVEVGGDDCADFDADIHPGAVEQCDGAGEDEDCDGLVDGADPDAVDVDWYVDADADGWGAGTATTSCEAPADSVTRDGDCDDGDAAVSPSAVETWYDGVDADCLADDDEDQDHDGYTLAEDCDDSDPLVRPYAWEVPLNGLDDDCDGGADLADPSGSLSLVLGDDDYVGVALPFPFAFCGESFDTAYVGANGWVTFRSGEGDYAESSANFVYYRAIAGLWDDLSPQYGEVVVVVDAGVLAVHFRSVPEFGSAEGNSFSIVLHESGVFDLGYEAIAATDGLAGYSCADTVGTEVDLTSLMDRRVAGAPGIGGGTETMMHEVFSGANDLSYSVIRMCGFNGTDSDRDRWSTTCGDTDDSDPASHPG